MSHKSDLIAQDIHAYLKQHENKQMLRFLTCGSVDDGKSTLIGRLLYDSKMIFEDQLAAIHKDSAMHGTTGTDFDPALLTDGLKAEREQGITIDVAYRYFSTDKRKFIIADTPGHEQYTRNMATGASNCDLAIILIDARHGILTQTKRHSFIVSLLGIKHVVVAINKMDLVDFSEERFNEIRDAYIDFASRLEMGELEFIPMSALHGDNVVERSGNTPWYEGPPLLAHLETVPIQLDRNLIDLRLPVQYVIRPDLNFRGFAGTIASGLIRKGDEVLALPSGRRSTVKSIVTFDGEVEEAFPPQAVTITLNDEIDISRGDMLVHPGNRPHLDRDFEAMLVWMTEEPLVPGKRYLIKQSTAVIEGQIKNLRYAIDVNALHRQPQPRLGLNEVGRVSMTTARPLCYDAYKNNHTTGSFIVIDKLTNNTIAAGMIIDREADDDQAHWDDAPASDHLETEISSVTPAEREARYGQKPATLLITGLTGSGKSTLAYALERALFDQGHAAAVLDGQNLRSGISRDLGFTAGERSENLRRGAHIAKLFNDAGIITIGAFVAPSAEVRKKAAEVVGEDHFLTIYLNTPIEACRERDDSEMYTLADQGKITDFPGVSSDYEAPENPDLTFNTAEVPIEACVKKIIALLKARGVMS